MATSSRSTTHDWRKGKTIMECNKHMLEKELGCDITFVVGPTKERIKAHKFMLMARSIVFHDKLVNGAMTECVVSDVDPVQFRNILRYIYYDYFQGNITSTHVLYRIACKYRLDELQSRCLNFLKFNLSVNNTYDVLQHVYSINEESSKRAACEYFLKYSQILIGKEEFTELPQRCVIDLLKTGRLDVPEEKIYEAVVRWSKQECRRMNMTDNRPNHQLAAREVMKHINFLKMDEQYFNDKVASEQIVEQSLIITIFQQIISRSQRSQQSAQQQQPRQQEMPHASSVHPSTSAPAAQASQSATAHRDVTGASSDRQQSQAAQSPASGASKALPPRFPQVPTNTGSPSQLQELSRFTGVSSGKGYLFGRQDAICFMSNVNVRLHGIYIYGSQQRAGRYKFDLVILKENRVVCQTIHKENFETDGRQKMYLVSLDPVLDIKDNMVYTIKMTMKGVSSFYGTGGQNTVTCPIGDTDVIFTFLPFEAAENGTNAEIGQFPKFQIEPC